VRPFGLCDWAFNFHVVNLAVVFSLSLLVLEAHIGASGDGVYGSEG
jgi:hypothetical protein